MTDETAMYSNCHSNRRRRNAERRVVSQFSDLEVSLIQAVSVGRFLAVDEMEPEAIAACEKLFAEGLLCRDVSGNDYTLSEAGLTIAHRVNHHPRAGLAQRATLAGR